MFSGGCFKNLAKFTGKHLLQASALKLYALYVSNFPLCFTVLADVFQNSLNDQKWVKCFTICGYLISPFKKLKIYYIEKNTVISPNFLVWKFCGKAQFPHTFGQIARNYAGTVPFHKISTTGN